MIKCCIFDLDGTILDTISTITYYLNNSLALNGISKVSEDECKYFAGSGAKILVERAFRSKKIEDGDKEAAVLRDFLASYDNDPYYLTSIFEGVRELILRLKARGTLVAVVSNKPDFPAKSVVRKFFGELFDDVVGARDGIPVKPDTRGACEVLSRLGVKPSETAWIGDSDIDMQTGKNLGAALNIGVSWGFRTVEELILAGANTVVSSAEEIYSEVISFD